MRRFSIGVLVVGLVTGALTTTALPAGANSDPHRFFLPAGPADFDAGLFCAFPVHLEVTQNKEYGKSTILKDGTETVKVSGSFKVTLTNTLVPKSIIVNASGPGTFTFFTDGTSKLEGSGHWLIFNPASVAATFGVSPLLLTSGQILETMNANFEVTSLSVTGRSVDLCKALA